MSSSFDHKAYYEEEGDNDIYYDEEEAYGYEDGENGDEYEYGEQSNEDGDDGVYYDEEEGYGYEDGENDDEYDYEEQTYHNEDCDDGVYFDEEEGYDYEDGENGEEQANYNEDCDDGVYFDKEEGYGSEENISINNGFVKEKVTFMVMDDLVIQPFTFTSMIEVVNKFNIKEIREMIVELGMNEGIKLLKASLESKMVLTSIFVNKEY
ncbi:uncharacterized protein LOC131623899 [Vicia villosa]|uniref:uncharacterized protein LOC131623899 n=1 Tax=Vicia villosa TaxID=3911 RepID=UPI00273CD4A8|nr:uncharacterized protein LOC131623899 [Vicia villosa]